jgi:MFS_1 like family
VSLWNNNLNAIFIVFAVSSLLFMSLSFTVTVEPEEYDSKSVHIIENDPNAPLLPNRIQPFEKSYGASGYKANLAPAESSSSVPQLPLNLSETGFFDDILHSLTKSMSYTSISSLTRTIREEADDYMEETGALTMGLALSRLPSMEASMAGILPYPTQDAEAPSPEMIWNLRIVSFLTTVFLYGMILAMINQFLFLFLQKDLGVASGWLGLTGPASAIMELTMFLFCKQLTETFGVTKLVVVAHIVTLIRSLAYTFLVPDLLITNCLALVLQMLNGKLYICE